MAHVIIHTDGGCSPTNPGPGGWAAVLRYGEHCKELSGGYGWTTNNRMELLAAIEALSALKFPCSVELHSDSRYLVDAVTRGWIDTWRRASWMRRGEPIPNADLWQRLLESMAPHEVVFMWVRGHTGVEDNERCDVLARHAAAQRDLPPDPGYQAPPSTNAPTGTTPRQHTKKIVEEGQPCRTCSTPVVKQRPKRKRLKTGQAYYYAYYFKCPSCHAMYMVEAAKRFVE